ncbi:hypothetical protein LCGC14_2311880 [marine sediment metagenome]|uniref:Uncharacterized protein n=1 Tax=marine sediment metagenome TaxID=412755 RepID=A0A0F9CKI2_9ZZZZ
MNWKAKFTEKRLVKSFDELKGGDFIVCIKDGGASKRYAIIDKLGFEYEIWGNYNDNK